MVDAMLYLKQRELDPAIVKISNWLLAVKRAPKSIKG